MNPQNFFHVGIVAACFAACAASTGCTTAGTAQASSRPIAARAEADARAVREVIHTYESALNSNDVEGILSLYGTEPVFMPQHSAPLVGRDAVRAGYQHVFQTIKLDIRFEVYEVQQAGDWAWARTSSAGRTRILANGTQIAEANNELFIFRHENGAWKIHRYLFATSRPRS